MADYKLVSGNILRVFEDVDYESPNDWGDTEIFLVYSHRQFEVIREGYDPKDIYQYLRAIASNEPLENQYNYDEYYIFPIDAYIHSGVHLSLSNTENYPDRRWDVSTTGYVLVNKDCTIHLSTEGCNKDDAECRALQVADNLIQIWNQYLSGDVYGFKVLKPIKTYTIDDIDLEDGMSRKEIIQVATENTEYEELDSCGGFYGEDINTNGMLDHIDDELMK